MMSSARNSPLKAHGVNAPLIVLALLMVIQLAVTIPATTHPLIADEIYYAAKASYFAKHFSFPQLTPEALASERGVWGFSDWRPQGYPVFVAFSGLFQTDDIGRLRHRVTLVQFTLLATWLITLLRLLQTCRSRIRLDWVAVVFLGVSPWLFELMGEILTDTVDGVLAGTALLFLWRFQESDPGTSRHLLIAMVLASATLLVRPEMILFAPIAVTAALLIRWRRGRARARDLVVAVVIYASFVGLQVGYRINVAGEPGIYGGLHIINRGVFDWANTWFGTEEQGYDYAYAITEARPHALPSWAFDSESERAAIARAERLVLARGEYLEEADRTFFQIAAQRRSAHPLRSLSIRLWHAAHLWLNIHTSPAVQNTLAPWPRAVRRVPYLFFACLKLLELALAAAALAMSARKMSRRADDAWDRLVLLWMSWVIARSILIGVVLGWKVHRYVIGEWALVLVCAILALREAGAQRKNSTETAPAPPGAQQGSI